MFQPSKTPFDPLAFLEKVGPGKRVLTFEPGQIIYSQGDVADSVFLIQEGMVKLVVVSKEGKEAVVGILTPGQFFGEGSLSGQSIRIGEVKAVEQSVVTAIDKKTMIEALHREPDLSELFMAFLLSRNTRIEADLVDQLFNSSEKRLARLLLLLANFGKEENPEPISFKMTQEVLAEMIGTTRSRVSFFMNRFRRLGFIEYNGKIQVHKSLLHAVLNDAIGTAHTSQD